MESERTMTWLPRTAEEWLALAITAASAALFLYTALSAGPSGDPPRPAQPGVADREPPGAARRQGSVEALPDDPPQGRSR